jgi:hypothetical protein
MIFLMFLLCSQQSCASSIAAEGFGMEERDSSCVCQTVPLRTWCKLDHDQLPLVVLRDMTSTPWCEETRWRRTVTVWRPTH